MKKLLIVLILSVASVSFATPSIRIDGNVEVLPLADYYELFAPKNQPTFIDSEGYISFGSYSYSVYEEYTILERQRIWQECQKYLFWNDQETLLYMYQYVVKPYPFPYLEFPLVETPTISVPIPNGCFLLLLGLVTLVFRRRV